MTPRLPRNRPLWRWLLFCVALDLSWRFKWPWLAHVYSWSVLPEWLGDPDEFESIDSTEAPF